MYSLGNGINAHKNVGGVDWWAGIPVPDFSFSYEDPQRRKRKPL